jgi:hypothetical protein
MARPKKHPHELRDARAVVRLTDEEQAELEQRAAGAGFTVSEYFRQCAFHHKPPADLAERRERASLTAALLRLGVNLNQIARHMNAGRDAPPDLPALLSDIRNHVDRLAYDTSGISAR